MSAIKKAAELLRHEAAALKNCHTIGDDWRGDPAQIEYEAMIAAADAAIAERDALRAELDALKSREGEVVYRWLALDYSGFCYGSNPPDNLPNHCNLKAFYAPAEVAT